MSAYHIGRAFGSFSARLPPTFNDGCPTAHFVSHLFTISQQGEETALSRVCRIHQRDQLALRVPVFRHFPPLLFVCSCGISCTALREDLNKGKKEGARLSRRCTLALPSTHATSSGSASGSIAPPASACCVARRYIASCRLVSFGAAGVQEESFLLKFVTLSRQEPCPVF